MTYAGLRLTTAPIATDRPVEPFLTRQPCYSQMTYYLKEACSPGAPGPLALAGAGCLTVGAGRFRLPAWLITDDPGREE
jgi:hypothetical protein